MAALKQSPMVMNHQSAPPVAASVSRSVSLKSLRSGFFSNSLSLKLSCTAGNLARRHRSGGTVMIDSAASRYACALVDAAKTNRSLEATSADMEKIEKLFTNHQIYSFFVNPVMDIEKKGKMIDEIVVAEKLQPYTANFLNILVDTNRIELIMDIVKEFEVFYNKLTETELALVSSVVKLDSKHLAQIAQSVQRLTGAKNVRIKTVIDPSLLAGFTIRYGNSGSKLIDMSVKKQLDEIAGQLDFEKMVGSLVG